MLKIDITIIFYLSYLASKIGFFFILMTTQFTKLFSFILASVNDPPPLQLQTGKINNKKNNNFCKDF